MRPVNRRWFLVLSVAALCFGHGPRPFGGELVANAPADGYTLVLATIAHNGAVKLFRNLRYDPAGDLQPVILLAESPSVLLVNDCRGAVQAHDRDRLCACPI
jgi:hypothetical protein